MTLAGHGYANAGRPLTPRMRQVLAAAAAGRTVTETARELGIAEPTVWSIRTAACARLAVPNVTAAVFLAASRDLL